MSGARRQRIITVTRLYFDIRPAHPHLDGAICSRLRWGRLVSERVLVFRYQGHLVVSLFYRVTRELGEHLAASFLGVIGENVAIALSREADALNLFVHRHGGLADSNAINRDLVSLEHLQHLVIAGVTAEFTTVADDEQHAAARWISGTQILGGSENSVVQYMSFRPI